MGWVIDGAKMIFNGKEYRYMHFTGGGSHNVTGKELLENANEDDLKYISNYFGGNLDVNIICSKIIRITIDHKNCEWGILRVFDDLTDVVTWSALNRIEESILREIMLDDS